jgi:hypothetical protein
MERRQFLTQAAVAAAAAIPAVHAASTARQDSEALTTTLYKSLTDAQRSAVCFPFDHPLRSKVDNNWFITPQRIGKFYTPDQQAMVEEIYRKLHNPDFAEKAMQRIKEDSGGLQNNALAFFGEPGKGKFEFVITGRHNTARCDADSVEGAAFGGPIFYGHQAGASATEQPNHPNNVYWYQAIQANHVFQALDGKQRERALLGEPRKEKATETVTLHGKTHKFAGLPVADLSKDQRALVEKTLRDLLLPFRKRDVDEAMKLIKAQGGVNSLYMSFYNNEDLGKDGVWDVWQLESHNMIWYFRGAPHVHVWANIRA